MKNHFMLRQLPLLLMSFVFFATAQGQDSLKKVAVKKTTTVVKPATNGIPINPKTGKPYSRYGYGTYAKTYHEKLKADSIKKAATAAAATKPTIAATTAPTPVKTDTPVTQPAPKADKSLYGQYQYLLTKVYNYQKPFVEAMWKSYSDTLRGVRKQLKESNDKTVEQTKTISSLQADVKAKEEALTKTDSISFIGIDVTKSTYNMIMWGLVLIIGIIAAVVIARTGGYRKEAIYRTTLYNELEEEFKTFKAKANEKEKKLARELQTERNKLDELMGRG